MDWATLGFAGPLPLKICILGFAPSRVEAPSQDPTWEIFGVNDVYFHTPRVTRTFELHHLKGLVEAGRRNAQYMEWLAKGKQPVYVIQPRPEFPSTLAFPFELLREAFPRAYFTNSIAWMTAFATLLLTEPADLADGRKARVARAGAQLALFGVDMAAETEFAAQRPSCEYFVGIAEGAGVDVYIPDTSDLCKAGALYGIDTTAPMRIKLELKINQSKQAEVQVDQQMAALQNQRELLLLQKGQLIGERAAYKYTRAAWTMPTDVVPSAEERARRHALPSETPNGQVPVAVHSEGG